MSRVEFTDMYVNIISFSDLIEVKRQSDRLKDLADVEELIKVSRETLDE